MKSKCTIAFGSFPMLVPSWVQNSTTLSRATNITCVLSDLTSIWSSHFKSPLPWENQCLRNPMCTLTATNATRVQYHFRVCNLPVFLCCSFARHSQPQCPPLQPPTWLGMSECENYKVTRICVLFTFCALTPNRTKTGWNKHIAQPSLNVLEQ